MVKLTVVTVYWQTRCKILGSKCKVTYKPSYIRPGLPSQQLTATLSGLSGVYLPAHPAPVTAWNHAWGQMWRPVLIADRVLHTDRMVHPVIFCKITGLLSYLLIVHGLTPEVVTRSSPYGDVNKQPMEVGDTMYHASSGMVKPTRVVSSPLASNMTGIYGQPGPTHGPHGTSGNFLYNNRPAIIYFDSGLTPEVVTPVIPIWGCPGTAHGGGWYNVSRLQWYGITPPMVWFHLSCQ